MLHRLTLILTATITTFFMAACAQKAVTVEELQAMPASERTTLILQAPQVGDLIAGDLEEFSEYSFGNGVGPAYGLMRVISTTADSAVVITADSGWYGPEEALEELASDLSTTGWDPDEEITITITELQERFAQGDILEARRLSASEIANYLD